MTRHTHTTPSCESDPLLGNTEKLVARLVVHGLHDMTTIQRREIAEWLRVQARALEASGNYSKRYTARFWKRSKK